MASIRGKKRQEYIQRWLNGEEDPEVEVMPTRVEGKYIVRPRGQKEETTVETTVTDTVNTSSNKDTEDSSSYYSEYEEEEIPASDEGSPRLSPASDEGSPRLSPEPVTPKRKGKKINQNDIQLEILHHLRIMGEEAIRKREKKERKREMKHVVRKEMSRSGSSMMRNSYYDYSDDDSDNEEVPPYYTNQRSVQQRYTTTPQPQPQPLPGGVAAGPYQVIYSGPSYKRRTLNLLSDYR